MRSCRWVPAFAGMTNGYCPTPPVFPAKAGIEGRLLGSAVTFGRAFPSYGRASPYPRYAGRLQPLAIAAPRRVKPLTAATIAARGRGTSSSSRPTNRPALSAAAVT